MDLPYTSKPRFQSGIRCVKWKFDDKQRNMQVEVINNGKTIAFRGSCYQYLYCKGNCTFNPGTRHYFEIKIDSSPGCYMGLGVCTEKWTQTNSYRIGQDAQSWSVRLYPGSDLTFSGKHHNGTSEQYHTQFAQGDRVGFLVDLSKGILTCYKNGESLGTCFENLKGKGKMYPIMELCHSSQASITEPKFKAKSDGKFSFILQ